MVMIKKKIHFLEPHRGGYFYLNGIIIMKMIFIFILYNFNRIKKIQVIIIFAFYYQLHFILILNIQKIILGNLLENQGLFLSINQIIMLFIVIIFLMKIMIIIALGQVILLEKQIIIIAYYLVLFSLFRYLASDLTNFLFFN